MLCEDPLGGRGVGVGGGSSTGRRDCGQEGGGGGGGYCLAGHVTRCGTVRLYDSVCKCCGANHGWVAGAGALPSYLEFFNTAAVATAPADHRWFALFKFRKHFGKKRTENISL